jgi:hypothetical protein
MGKLMQREKWQQTSDVIRRGRLYSASGGKTGDALLASKTMSTKIIRNEVPQREQRDSVFIIIPHFLGYGVIHLIFLTLQYSMIWSGIPALL